MGLAGSHEPVSLPVQALGAGHAPGTAVGTRDTVSRPLPSWCRRSSGEREPEKAAGGSTVGVCGNGSSAPAGPGACSSQPTFDSSRTKSAPSRAL